MLRESRARRTVGGRRGWGKRCRRDAIVVVFDDEGVGFNMSQLAPRTRIIVDTYVPFRWEPGLCPTFRRRHSAAAASRRGS